MIQGIGIDLVELDRVQEMVARHPNFPERILTKQELRRYDELSAHRKMEFLAGRYAAKEAFSKAMGTGVGADVSFQDVEILPDKKNKPVVKTPLFQGKVHVSITHTKTYAMAQILLEE